MGLLNKDEDPLEPTPPPALCPVAARGQARPGPGPDTLPFLGQPGLAHPRAVPGDPGNRLRDRKPSAGPTAPSRPLG